MVFLFVHVTMGQTINKAKSEADLLLLLGVLVV